LSEDLFGHPILLHSFQVTQPTYPLSLYPFCFVDMIILKLLRDLPFNRNQLMKSTDD
jgi:hypothetical protein